MRREALSQGPAGFFWMFSDPPKANERVGDVAIVHVRGELEHHESPWGGESYEGIVAKVEAAVSGQDCVLAHEREHKWDDDYEPMAAAPPKTIITCIDSPGGVVAGLNACVDKLRSLRASHPEIRWVVYVNEMAASAAYALACAMGSEIVVPVVSAISGSIGVISTMISQARKNEKDGYDVVLLTSGARKADGHAHAPISDAALDVERGRVEKLADAFFRLVSKTRGIPLAKVEGFQAGIYLSADAKKRGLVDAIMSFDDVLLAVGATADEASGGASGAGGNKTDRRLQPNVALQKLGLNSRKAPRSRNHAGNGQRLVAPGSVVKVKAPRVPLSAVDTPSRLVKSHHRSKAVSVPRLSLGSARSSTDPELLGRHSASVPRSAGVDMANSAGDSSLTTSLTSEAREAMIQLDALIAKTKAAIAKEEDPDKIASLAADLAAYKKTKKHVEHVETEEDDDPDDEDDDKKGDEDDDEDEKKSAAAKKDSEEKHSEEEKAKASEEDDEEEESEEKSAKAALAAVEKLTGMKGKAALGALQAMASAQATIAKDVAALKARNLESERANLMASLKGRSTKSEREWLSTQSLKTVRGFVEMRTKSGFVNTDDGQLVKPKHVDPSSEESLSADAQAMIAQAVAAMPGDQKAKDALRASLVKAHLDEAKKARPVLNGTGRI